MGKYSDHFVNAKAAQDAAEAKARADEEDRKAQVERHLAAGKKWLEENILPELASAKADLEGKVLIDHSQAVETRQTPTGVVHSVFFTVNPLRSSSFQSFRFEVQTNSRGWVSTLAHNPEEQTSRERNFRGNLERIKIEGFEKLVAGLVQGIVDLKV